MLDSLFKVKFNWLVLFVLSVVFYAAFPQISLLSYLAIVITLQQILLLFYSLNYIIPIRYLAGSLMCVQMLVGPVFAYNGANSYQYFKYKMQVSEMEYFSYAIPACIFFIIGLHVFSNLKGEFANKAYVEKFVADNPKIMYWFIGIGFVASFGSGIEGNLTTYFFYIISGFQFVGVFIMMLGSKILKPAPLIFVFGSVLISAFATSMFHDLITWSIFLIAVICIKYKPAVWVKAIFGVVFMLAIVVLQVVKGTYRNIASYGSNNGGIEAFQNVVENANEDGTLFSNKALANATVRINQGFIVTYVMRNIPAREPYANGEELYRILEAAILPRFLAPNKLRAGDNSMIEKYAGFHINYNTSMSLSALGDGYANFGAIGGCIFMLGLGGLFNAILIGFNNRGKVVPIILVFIPLVFYYPIRPDTALQTSLGHMVKVSVVLYIFSIIWEEKLKRKVSTEKIKLKEEAKIIAP